MLMCVTDADLYVVGHIPNSRLVLSAPDFNKINRHNQWPHMLLSSCMIALIGYMIAIGAGSICAQRSGYIVDVNQEAFAHGVW